MAVSDHYIVISNRFLRFFSLFDHAGNPIVHITMERPDSPLPEYAPGQLTSGFAYVTGDIAVDGAGMVYLASLPVDSGGIIDVWDPEGLLAATLLVNGWPMHVSVGFGSILVADDRYGNDVWLYQRPGAR